MKQISTEVYQGEKRFITNCSKNYNDYIKAAKEYVNNLKETRHYMYLKPYDQGPHNISYYSHMNNILNLLRKMDIRNRGRVLEIGSGPGWVTEILIGLGFNVDVIEPSEDFIQIAKERIDSYVKHLHLKIKPCVVFHCTTIEEFEYKANSYDGLIFYDVLHHVIDENNALEKCYRLLLPGGRIGIHEGAWIPENKQLESDLIEEMKKYSTLESPFVPEYLEYLLNKIGFIDITRYHQINGLFPINLENSTILKQAQIKANNYNIITATKFGNDKTTRDVDYKTLAEITILESKFDPKSMIFSVQLKLFNVGETIWLSNPEIMNGWVSIAIYQGSLDKKDFREANRIRISNDIAPKESVIINAKFHLPKDYNNGPWFIDLINEGYFWYSAKGTIPAKIVVE